MICSRLVVPCALLCLIACQEEPEPRLTDVMVDITACVGDVEGRLLDGEGRPRGDGCRRTLVERAGSGAVNACFVVREAEQDARFAYVRLKLDHGGLQPVGPNVVAIEPGVAIDASLFVFGEGFDGADCAPGRLTAEAACDGACLLKLTQPTLTVAKARRAGAARTSPTVITFAGRDGVCLATTGAMPAEEVCDGIDNDCNGVVDDNVAAVGDPCARGVGGCEAQGVLVCDSAAGEIRCSAEAGEPRDEACNGIDDDCDGEVDEAAPGVPLTRPCYDGPAAARGVGECAEGLQTCTDGAWAAECRDQVLPQAEVCDGLDNDCDGERDEDDGQLQRDRENCGQCGTACGAGLVCDAGACRSACRLGLTECDGGCADLQTDRQHCGQCGRRCAGGEACEAGACVPTCGEGFELCDGCRDLQTDREHCGFCDNPCAAGEVCADGACEVSCGAGLTDCDGVCRDLDNNRLHCGACGRACPPGEACAGGVCQLICGAGLADCDGVCRDLLTDRAHCGACDEPCPAGHVCANGACDLVCGGGLSRCGDGCRDLAADRLHCGRCDRACHEGEVCSAGECRLSCGGGLDACGGVCRDLQVDPRHCGACDRACAEGERCSFGGCQLSCAAGLTDCDGVCRDLDGDRAHCGACDRPCAAGEVCRAARCLLECAAGLAECDGACRDLETDRAHCGACGRQCAAGEVCAAGECRLDCPAGLTNCGGQCTNTRFDPAHCGGCAGDGGLVCAAADNARAVCANGECGLTCDPDFANCDNDDANGCEADLRADIDHCGRCGAACPAVHNATLTCAPGGACGYDCVAGFVDCDGDPGNGCEAELRADVDRCGDCDTACPGGPNAQRTCTEGACGLTCDAHFGDCNGEPEDGCEIDLHGDVMHCGACDVACPERPNATTRCADGQCAFTCDADFGDCDGDPGNGCETDLRTSVEHCGQCDNTCPGAPNAAATCADRACGVQCDADYADCDGSAANGCEAHLPTDVANCGACRTTCGESSGTPICDGGCRACQSNQECIDRPGNRNACNLGNGKCQ